MANKQIKQIIRRRIGKSRRGQNWCKARIGKNGWPTGSFAGDRGARGNHPGRACDERPVGEDLMEEGADQRIAPSTH